MFEGQYFFHLLLVIIVAGSASYFTNIGLKDIKYLSANKPSWYPPGYVFGIVWTIIYLLYSYSWTKASYFPLLNILFYFNMILNFLWCFLFFYIKDWNSALGVLLLLSVLLGLQISLLYKLDNTASLLLIPYFLWSLFASYLNYTVISLN